MQELVNTYKLIGIPEPLAIAFVFIALSLMLAPVVWWP